MRRYGMDEMHVEKSEMIGHRSEDAGDDVPRCERILMMGITEQA
ncbi:hypothetical protein [Paenibacillus phytorum]|nr:hypothetical protein [Paenibacillus phytorum]